MIKPPLRTVVQLNADACSLGTSLNDESPGINSHIRCARLYPARGRRTNSAWSPQILNRAWQATKQVRPLHEQAYSCRTDISWPIQHTAGDFSVHPSALYTQPAHHRPAHKDLHASSSLVQQNGRFEGALSATDDQYLFAAEFAEVVVVRCV